MRAAKFKPESWMHLASNSWEMLLVKALISDLMANSLRTCSQHFHSSHCAKGFCFALVPTVTCMIRRSTVSYVLQENALCNVSWVSLALPGEVLWLFSSHLRSWQFTVAVSSNFCRVFSEKKKTNMWTSKATCVLFCVQAQLFTSFSQSESMWGDQKVLCFNPELKNIPCFHRTPFNAFINNAPIREHASPLVFGLLKEFTLH